MSFADRSVARPFPPARGRVAPAVVAPRVADEPLPRNRVRDLTALALLAGCVFLVAALATFHPADPPAARMLPAHLRAVNACGLIGSAVAAAVFEWFGLGGWFVTGFVLALTWALLRRQPLPDLPLRTAGAIIAAAGSGAIVRVSTGLRVDRVRIGTAGRA
ncbi:MAG: DNA translocase FtsK 4TM domain-containing protein, partial [Planctomycetaceae bacterium]